MVKVGDKVLITLSDEVMKDLVHLDNPTGKVGDVTYVGISDEFYIHVEIPKEDPEDQSDYPEWFNEDELEVVTDG